jgi:large subunit ribosomal protein L25
MKVELRIEPLRVVRGMDKVPGVVFGKDFDPISIQIDAKEFQATLNEYGTSQTFNIKVGKKTHTVYIKDVQRDAIKQNHFLNVKLQKVSKGDTITTRIPLNIMGRELVERANVSVHIIADSLEVEYGVGMGVSHIDLDVSKLNVGDTIRVNELTIPEGLKVLDDPEKLVINVVETIQPDPDADVEEDTDVDAADPTKVEAIKQKADQ